LQATFTDHLYAGFHASTAEEYAEAFAKALSLPKQEILAMRLRARSSAQRFTEEAFSVHWIGQLETLVRLQLYPTVEESAFPMQGLLTGLLAGVIIQDMRKLVGGQVMGMLPSRAWMAAPGAL